MTKEFPLYNHAPHCPTARNVGGVSQYLCECAKPIECKGAQLSMLDMADTIRAQLPPHTGTANTDFEREVMLYATNHGKLYERNVKPAIRELAQAVNKGRLFSTDFVAGFRPAANTALWEYAIEHADKQWYRENSTRKNLDLIATELAYKYVENIAYAAYYGHL